MGEHLHTSEGTTRAKLPDNISCPSSQTCFSKNTENAITGVYSMFSYTVGNKPTVKCQS